MPRKVEWCWGRGSTPGRPRGLLAVLGALGALGAVTVPAEKVLAADNACAQLQLTAGTLSELCAAAVHSCTAAFAPGGGRFSCAQVCETAGLRCEAAYDDAFDDGRCPAGARASTSFWTTSHVCLSPATPSRAVGHPLRGGHAMKCRSVFT